MSILGGLSLYQRHGERYFRFVRKMQLKKEMLDYRPRPWLLFFDNWIFIKLLSGSTSSCGL